MQTQYQIKEYSRRRQLILWSLLVVLVIGLMGASYFAGVHALGVDSRDMENMRSRVIKLNQQVAKLKKENKTLLNQTIKLKRDAEFNRAGEITAKQALAEAQKKLADSNQELIFFKSLLNPDGESQKLKVHSFTLESTASLDDASTPSMYRLVLTKFRDSTSYKKGHAEFAFKFASGKTVKQIKPYKFKFFQRIYGDVPVIEGKMPNEIVLKLFNSSGSKVLFEKTYPWSNFISGES